MTLTEQVHLEKNWKIKIAQYVKKPQKQQGDSALF